MRWFVRVGAGGHDAVCVLYATHTHTTRTSLSLSIYTHTLSQRSTGASANKRRRRRGGGRPWAPTKSSRANAGGCKCSSSPACPPSPLLPVLLLVVVWGGWALCRRGAFVWRDSRRLTPLNHAPGSISRVFDDTNRRTRTRTHIRTHANSFARQHPPLTPIQNTKAHTHPNSTRISLYICMYMPISPSPSPHDTPTQLRAAPPPASTDGIRRPPVAGLQRARAHRVRPQEPHRTGLLVGG